LLRLAEAALLTCRFGSRPNAAWLAVYRPMAQSSVAVAMKKYWHVINIGIQNTLVYRVNFLFRAAFALIPLAAVLFLWRAIYAGKESGGEVAGYTLAQMTSYYLLVTIVDALTAVNEDDWQIAATSRMGTSANSSSNPSIIWLPALFVRHRPLIYTAIAVVPVHAVHSAPAEFFVLPPDWAMFGWFLVSDGHDGAAAILHVLHDGAAGVLGARSFRRSYSSCSPSNTLRADICFR